MLVRVGGWRACECVCDCDVASKFHHAFSGARRGLAATSTTGPASVPFTTDKAIIPPHWLRGKSD